MCPFAMPRLLPKPAYVISFIMCVLLHSSAAPKAGLLSSAPSTQLALVQFGGSIVHDFTGILAARANQSMHGTLSRNSIRHGYFWPHDLDFAPSAACARPHIKINRSSLIIRHDDYERSHLPGSRGHPIRDGTSSSHRARHRCNREGYNLRDLWQVQCRLARPNECSASAAKRRWHNESLLLLVAAIRAAICTHSAGWRPGSPRAASLATNLSGR